MPRVSRGLEDKLIYHIVKRGNRRQKFFLKTVIMKHLSTLCKAKVFNKDFCLLFDVYSLSYGTSTR
jgi:REP element-mobilizing transposase RayT